MGFSGISIWNLLIILAIVVLLFGTKRLKSLGSDLGGMLKGFKDSMADGSKDKEETPAASTPTTPKAVEQQAQSTAQNTTVDQTNTQQK